jgi:hypothetical protein
LSYFKESKNINKTKKKNQKACESLEKSFKEESRWQTGNRNINLYSL